MTLSRVRITKSCALALFLFLSINAHAGTVGGGGGKGVVCRNADQSIKSVELLDLWEARVLHQQTAHAVTNSLASAVETALLRLKNSFLVEDREYHAGILLCEGQDCLLKKMRDSAKRFLTSNASVLRLKETSLEPTDDAMEIAKPKNCSIEQLVIYQPSGGQIFVDQDLVDHMDLTNHAALIAHEAYYHALRIFQGERNSLRVRRAIGFVFAGNTFELTMNGPNGSLTNHARPGDIICESKDQSYIPDSFDPGHFHIVISKDCSKIGFRALGASRLIGDTASGIVESPRSLCAVVIDRPCQGANGAGATTWPSMGGPVEYDRAINITRACVDGRAQVIMSMRRPGEAQFTNYPVTCKIQK